MLPPKALHLFLGALLLLGAYTTGLIVPEELPTILSLIYSNIPPIKKGTDSRLGVGFRLGEHADFQIILELGPQKYTDSIGNDVDSKRKRATMMYAAIKGELGPWAQAIAKYQIEEKMKKIVENYKLNTEKSMKMRKNTNTKKSEGSDWLSKWSQSVEPSNSSSIKETATKIVVPNYHRMKVVNSQINSDSPEKEKAQNDFILLKKMFGSNGDETKSIE